MANIGDLLRYWRDVRRQSQFDLALASGVSQRHISFVESGRSVPSREILILLAQTLDVPLRDRNVLLAAAGYASIYPEGSWDDAEMQVVTRALDRMLRQHEPYPAFVMDRYWNVVTTNRAAPALFNRFIDMTARTGPRNLLHLMFDPAGLRPHIADWETVAASLIQRVHREALGRYVDQGTSDLLESLLAYPDVRAEWRLPRAFSSASTAPVIPIGLIRNGHILRYFSMVSTVGTPQTVAAQELRVECMFPGDDDTEGLHHALMAGEI